jgi:hypothetical protein
MPLLFLDVDGVISLFGFDTSDTIPGRFYSIDGILHCISASCVPLLGALRERFELVWATGWEEKANEYLPHALGLPERPPHLSFAPAVPAVDGHWKLEAINRYAWQDRPVAWIDDAHDDRCRAWARDRPGPTLLVTTDPASGLTQEHVVLLLAWANGVN